MALWGDPAGERGPGMAAVAGRGYSAPPRPASSSEVTDTVARVELVEAAGHPTADLWEKRTGGGVEMRKAHDRAKEERQQLKQSK